MLKIRQGIVYVHGSHCLADAELFEDIGGFRHVLRGGDGEENYEIFMDSQEKT